jgi:hypothetical protein
MSGIVMAINAEEMTPEINPKISTIRFILSFSCGAKVAMEGDAVVIRSGDSGSTKGVFSR